jgi:hypothetical protein
MEVLGTLLRCFIRAVVTQPRHGDGANELASRQTTQSTSEVAGSGGQQGTYWAQEVAMLELRHKRDLVSRGREFRENHSAFKHNAFTHN